MKHGAPNRPSFTASSVAALRRSFTASCFVPATRAGPSRPARSSASRTTSGCATSRPRTQYAAKRALLARGVFGAPAFVVTAPGVAGDLFWGQDRLDFVEKSLGGWSVKEGNP